MKHRASGSNGLSARYGTKLLLGSACLLGSLFVGCEDFQVGPSLTSVAVVEKVTVRDGLVPTTANPNICCCRVEGTVTNNNEVAVHVTIKWAAFSSEQAVDPFARILHFIKDLQPSQTQAFVTENNNGPGASGFLVPCASIRDLRREVDVNGIVFPAGS